MCKDSNEVKNSAAQSEQDSCSQTLESGIYLGFYLPGARVLLSKVDSGGRQVRDKSPVLSRPLSGLFDHG